MFVAQLGVVGALAFGALVGAVAWWVPVPAVVGLVVAGLIPDDEDDAV